jgi:two-component system nitrate/nitrite response regulator NarL
MSAARVFLVDASQLFRDGLRRLLEDHGCTVVGQASSLNAAADRLPATDTADMVVFDFVPDEDCGGAIERLRAASPATKLVVLTSDLSRKALTAAIGWSVHSYLPKDMSAEALVRSFDLIMLDQQIFPTKLMIEMQQEADATAGSLRAQKGLSARELEILRALVGGKSNKAIARDLNIAEATVKVHLKALLRKVRVSNRTQAAIWAMNQGLERVA